MVASLLLLLLGGCLLETSSALGLVLLLLVRGHVAGQHLQLVQHQQEGQGPYLAPQQ
jgi:hypothetical protein